MTTDSISDLIARIKNACMRKKAEVIVPKTKTSKNLLEILKQENYIHNFEVLDKDINVELKYLEDKPVIINFERMSKPGLRIYHSYKEMPKVLSGLGLGIYSTSRGIITNKQAKKEKIGGEYLCRVW